RKRKKKSKLTKNKNGDLVKDRDDAKREGLPKCRPFFVWLFRQSSLYRNPQYFLGNQFLKTERPIPSRNFVDC
ncbi:MAG: hypothetical protein ACKOCH_05100, partial [Bacteroidota bacterium]